MLVTIVQKSRNRLFLYIHYTCSVAIFVLRSGYGLLEYHFHVNQAFLILQGVPRVLSNVLG